MGKRTRISVRVQLAAYTYWITELEQFAAREVCVGLVPSPRATRCPHEHCFADGSAPRSRTVLAIRPGVANPASSVVRRLNIRFKVASR